jgi:broad specificity phosphatase PhoE
LSDLVLVRHGHAAAGWDADADPGLSDVGRSQAAAVKISGPRPLYTSPMRRCRETAAAIAVGWGIEPIVFAAVGEIESPIGALEQRGSWLRGVMAGRWSEQSAAVQSWRQRVIDGVLSLEGGDAVVVSHFVAINVIVGHATGDDRVVVFAPNNCSCTQVRVDRGTITVLSLGGEAQTVVT